MDVLWCLVPSRNTIKVSGEKATSKRKTNSRKGNAVATNQNVILIKMCYVPNFKVLKWERYEWEPLIEISFSKPSVVCS